MRSTVAHERAIASPSKSLTVLVCHDLGFRRRTATDGSVRPNADIVMVELSQCRDDKEKRISRNALGEGGAFTVGLLVLHGVGTDDAVPVAFGHFLPLYSQGRRAREGEH